MLPPVEELAGALAKLPGFGRRSAARAALQLVKEPERLSIPLAYALERARSEMCVCEQCGAFTTRSANPCRFCTDPLRDGATLCIVEEAADVETIEASGAFKGRYHVLGGRLSARNRNAPPPRIPALLERIETGTFREAILAVSTDMEGDATCAYLQERLAPAGLKITRLAFGLPADSGVAYSDPLTLRRAILHRSQDIV